MIQIANRGRQIDTLKIFNDNVSEITENEKYSIGFMSGTQAFNLIIYLPPNFPTERPKLTITPIVHHSWVNETNGEIQNALGLVNFTIHSELGRVVQAIIREFERTPLKLVHVSEGIDNPVQSNMSHQIESSFPELNNLSIDELKRLNDNPDYLNDVVESMNEVQTLAQELDHLIVEVEATANENLLKETKLNELKSILEKQDEEFRILGDEYQEKNQRYLTKAEEYVPQHIQELLQIAASTADSECETHVQQFLNRTIDTQTFLERYQAAKQLSAMRKCKADRLAKQLNALDRANY